MKKPKIIILLLTVITAAACHTISHDPAPNDVVYMSHYQLRELSVSEFPERILADMEKTGLDNSPFLNRYESAFLNELLPDSLKCFDFTNKKVGFITACVGCSKKGYFEMHRKHFADDKYALDSGMLYILDDRQKKESGGFDALILIWYKFILSEEEILKLLTKYKVEEE